MTHGLTYKVQLPIETSDRGNAGVPVFLQDQTTELLGVPFLFDRGSFVLDGSTVRDTSEFDAVAGHGISVGEILEFANQSTFMQARVLIVLADHITIDTPFNHVYTGGDTMVRSSDDLQVDGSVTSQIFTIKPLPGQVGDFTRVILVIESGSAMDYTKFGSITALLNGCVLRVKRENGDYRNIFNWKTNGEFIEHSFDSLFENKSGGGGFGFVGRSTFAGQSKRGVAIRLDGDLGEELQVIVQDNLTIGLTKLKMVGQGHELQL
jgi:hypothetical protein